MNTIIEGIKYVFHEKDWEKKFGFLFIAILITYAITSIFSLFFQLPLEVAKSYFEEIGRNTTTVSSLSSLASSITSIFTLPLTLYIYGYLLQTVKNISEGKKEVVESHNDIMKTFVKGAKLYLSLLIASLPLGIVQFILIIVIITGGSYLLFGYPTESTSLIINGLLLITVLFGVFVSVINKIVKLASAYIYTQTGSFRESFNFKRIYSTIRASEKSFLRLFFHLIVVDIVQMIAFFAALILLCISFLTIPFVVTVGHFLKAYVIGRYYLMINNQTK